MSEVFTESLHTLMPLLGSVYVPGHCLETAQAMKDKKEREIALGEYYYFSGHPEEAAARTEKFLTEPNLGIRLSACFVYGYANLTMNRIPNSRYALDQIRMAISGLGEGTSPQERNMALFISRSAATLLHLPLDGGTEHEQTESVNLNLLPPGLRLFACYVRAHQAYLKQDYSRSIGIIDTAIELTPQVCPISLIYLHLAATMDYMSLKQPEQAKEHLLKAWDLARPDNLLEPFGEHHGLLGGSLEGVIKKDWPEEFRRMIDITYGFSAGWRKIHNPDTGDEVADNLTTTEFAIAMLASRNWTNQEIAAHMGLSANTVKWDISVILHKLGLAKRSDLKKKMLK
ncbi:MAG: helix-turn-helix transcriptional regulator [Lachnospiraceae bacterium]|nr:helix-turn-helix transcriptional regulator [Lachnospiraceae bacterium]